MKHHKTLAIQCDDIGARCDDISARVEFTAISAQSLRRYWRGVSGDCRVGITPQMCNRVTNHRDMGTFSKPGPVHRVFNTLTGHAVGLCDLPDRAGHFLPDINVHAISNFLPSSLVLDIFFCMKLFAIKFSLGIFVFYFKYCNNIANNTRESKNLCEKCFFVFFCKTNKYIPYADADNVNNDYIIYIYYTTIYNLYLYYMLAKLYTGKTLVKKMQGTRGRAQRHA